MPHPHAVKAPHGHGHPGGEGQEKKYLPRLIAWEVTRSCILNCVHCRAAARFGPYPGELATEECFKFLDNVKSFSDPIIILTGGEPMMRPDIYDIAKYGTKLGLRMVMAPCGLLVTEELAQKIKDSGVMRVSLSIDGLTAEQHNNFRRVEGAFEGVMKAIENFKKVGMEFQVNTTITKHNVKDLPKLLEMVIKLGAVAYHPFLLVPTGRGKELVDQEIPPAEYESTLKWFYEMRDKVPIQFKPTCAAWQALLAAVLAIFPLTLFATLSSHSSAPEHHGFDHPVKAGPFILFGRDLGWARPPDAQGDWDQQRIIEA